MIDKNKERVQVDDPEENVEITKLVFAISKVVAVDDEVMKQHPFILIKALIRCIQLLVEDRITPADPNVKEEIISAIKDNLEISISYIPNDEENKET